VKGDVIGGAVDLTDVGVPAEALPLRPGTGRDLLDGLAGIVDLQHHALASGGRARKQDGELAAAAQEPELLAVPAAHTTRLEARVHVHDRGAQAVDQDLELDPGGGDQVERAPRQSGVDGVVPGLHAGGAWHH